MATPHDPVPAGMPPENQARARLRSFPEDSVEAWLARQRWRAAPDGSWRVAAERDGWTYRIEGAPGGFVRVVAWAVGAGCLTSWLIE
jgi:hypothetical protein